MSTGVGVSGGQGRCHPFWLELATCIRSKTREELKHEACVNLREDYFECLHQTKATARVNAIEAEYNRRKKEGTLPAGVEDLLTTDFKRGVPSA
eukprot:m.224510 g.224510  ORF g.224510 m.224510 type:complete len:94 (+) comp16481_c0_seq1:13-294(+)